uniref:Uncharacterized protein n=1 Tax=Cyanoderma ruficeps TaxID=181631 RepID=A0A8C3QYZ7_9PASS
QARHKSGRRFPTKESGQRARRREHRDRSPTAPEHPKVGDTATDPRVQRQREGVAGAGSSPPGSCRRAKPRRPPLWGNAGGCRGPFRSPQGETRLCQAARTGPGSERGKRHGRTCQEETTRPHTAAADHPHTVHPRNAGGGQPLPAAGAPLGGPALSQLPGRRGVGTPAVLSNGEAAAGGCRQGPGRRTRGPGSAEPAPRSLWSGAGLVSPADCTGAGAAGAGPRGPRRQWGSSGGGAARRGRARGAVPGQAARPGMSSERGNVSRTRSQRHQNARAFQNDKYDTSARLKKINAKLHDGVCQHCKGILEWRVKFRKYKLLTKPKKCVKCLQKTVKDPYHVICRPCAGKLEICAKCGKQEEIVIPIDKGQDRTESETSKNGQESSKLKDELDFDTNFGSADSGEDSDALEEQLRSINFETAEI